MLNYDNERLHWCLNAPIENVLAELHQKMVNPLLNNESEVLGLAITILPIIIMWVRDLYGAGIQPPALHKWVGSMSAWREASHIYDVSVNAQNKINEFVKSHNNMDLDQQINFSVAGLIVADLLIHGNSHAYYSELLIES